MNIGAIELALLDWEILNGKGRWASFECSPEGGVRVRTGVIHSDGTKEQHIVTRKYYETDGRVQVVCEVRN